MWVRVREQVRMRAGAHELHKLTFGVVAQTNFWRSKVCFYDEVPTEHNVKLSEPNSFKA